jgi:hypothetical protein
MDIDVFIEHTKEKAREYRYHADFFGNDNPMNTACIKSAEDCEQLADWLTKLKEYQQLEEQGRLIKLPCKDVYFIVDINDPKYAMVMGKPIRDLAIYEIESIDKENCKYFSTEEKAEAKLKELRGEENGLME